MELRFFIYPTLGVFLCVVGSLEATIQKSASLRVPQVEMPVLSEVPVAAKVIEEKPPAPKEEEKSSFEGFVKAAYTLWCASEEGLTFGRSGVFISGDDPYFHTTNSLLSQHFQYQPGFEVGLGLKKDLWTLKGEYTWVANTVSQTSFAPVTDFLPGTGVWVIAPWFLQKAADQGSLSGTSVSTEWHLRMDIADLNVSYLLSEGKYFALIPYGGLRAAWIRQKVKMIMIETPFIVSVPYPGPLESITGSQSWSLGPRFGTEVDVFLGLGFRVEGAVDLSLLYTQYQRIYHREDQATDDFPSSQVSASTHHKQALRPVLECGLGVGWKTPEFAKQCAFDFSVRYDFMLWWNQNMMRYMMNSFWNGTPVNGDLFLHGITATGSFSF